MSLKRQTCSGCEKRKAVRGFLLCSICFCYICQSPALYCTCEPE